MRKKILAANWKLNKNPKEAFEFIKDLCKSSMPKELEQLVIFPSCLLIDSCLRAAKESSLNIGIQNIHSQNSGAFTGENSALVAKEMGVNYFLVGHSERRSLFKETEQEISEKVALLCKEGLNIMLCLGESLEEREANRTNEVLERQLKSALQLLGTNLPKLVLAYEPVWAIGTGKQASPEQAKEAHAFIRDCLAKLSNSEYAQKTSILYGGSVKADNAANLIAQDGIDGFLVGGASLELGSFKELIKLSL